MVLSIWFSYQVCRETGGKQVHKYVQEVLVLVSAAVGLRGTQKQPYAPAIVTPLRSSTLYQYMYCTLVRSSRSYTKAKGVSAKEQLIMNREGMIQRVVFNHTEYEKTTTMYSALVILFFSENTNQDETAIVLI